MSREIRWIGSGQLQVFDDPWQGGYRARLFRLDEHGRWHPPLPPDIEVPAERSRSRGPALVRSAASRDERPAWLLNRKEPEPWRLRR